MTASVTDHFRQPTSGTRPEAAYLTGTKTIGASSITINVATGWPTATGVDFIIFRKDGTGQLVPGTVTTWIGTLSGTTISNLTLKAGTDQEYANGEQSVVIMSVTAAWGKSLVDGILTHADQDGTLKDGAVDVSTVLADGVVSTAKVADSAITNAKVATGACVQHSYALYTALAAGTTLVPSDDTIPQSTEGDQYMTLTHTPKSATNKLDIEVIAFMSSSNSGNNIIGALFKDSDADAMAAGAIRADTADAPEALIINHVMTAGTTSAITFKFRAGPQVAATVRINGTSIGRIFGGITKSSIRVREYKA